MNIRRWEWRLYVRTIRHRQTDMTKIIVAFRGVKASKKGALLDMGALGGTVGWDTALQA